MGVHATEDRCHAWTTRAGVLPTARLQAGRS